MTSHEDKALSDAERSELELLRRRVAELEGDSDRASWVDDPRLRQALAMARIGSWEWDPNTDQVSWFGDMFRIYGVRPEDFTGRGSDYLSATRTDYRAQQLSNLEAAWKAGVTEKAFRAGAVASGELKELCIVRPDGTECFTLGEAICIVDAEGHPLRMVGVTLDVTDRKRAEEVLRGSEERYRQLFDACPDGVVLIGPDGRIERANIAQARMYGYDSPEALVGLPATDLVAPPSRALATQVLSRRLSGESLPAVEYELARRNGTTFHGETLATILRRADGAVAGYICVTRDTTERRRAEEALRRSESRLHVALEAARAGSWEWILATNENIWSAEVWALYGRDPRCEVASYETWLESIVPDDRAAVTAEVRRASSSGSALSIEWRVNTADGSLRWLLSRGQPERDADGKVCRYVGIVLDITDRKRADEERERQHEHLVRSQKLESLATLARGIAHDFNNLLSGFYGNVNLAQTSLLGQDLEGAAAYLDHSFRTLERARGLTQQLVTFAKGGEPLLVPTDLGAFVRETLLFSLSGSKLKCNIAVAPDLWPCSVDRTQLGQVLDNLAINARQALPDGGDLRVDLRNVELGVGEAAPLLPGRYVRVTVVDDGPGILPEHIGRIFDPFFTTKQGNSGLGLATSHSIVQRHGGHLSVESELGQGATFRILLPALAAAAAAGATRPSPQLRLAGRRILVLDDEDVLRNVTAALLRRLGAEVTAVANGDAAVAADAEARSLGRAFDAFILDLTIPGEPGGRDVVARLRSVHPSVRAIATSGYSDDPVIAHPEDFGFAVSLRKPHTPDELEAALQAALAM